MTARSTRSFLCSLLAFIALSCAWAQPLAHALAREQLSSPKNPVILEITGKIARTNAPDRAIFDRAMLEELGTTTVQTSTPWTDGIQKFRGVLVRDVLDLAGAEGKVIRAIALNDYIIDIPVADFRDYPVLLALEMNGAELKVRDKGPIWIVYPLDQFEDLKGRRTERKMVWQLKELQVR